MEKLETRVVIKNFCKKGIPPKEIHEDFIETLGKESPSYSTVKKWTAEFKRGESIENDRRPMKLSSSCTSWLCVIDGDTYEAYLAKWAYVLGQYNQS